MDCSGDAFASTPAPATTDYWHTFTVRYGKHAGKKVDLKESAIVWFLERAEASRKAEVLELTDEDRTLMQELRIGVQ
jgi:hypothetical protein